LGLNAQNLLLLPFPEIMAKQPLSSVEMETGSQWTGIYLSNRNAVCHINCIQL